MNLFHKLTDIKQLELAKQSGFILGHMHFFLKVLAAKGWFITNKYQNNPDKLFHLNLYISERIAHKPKLAIDFLKCKKSECVQLKREIVQLSEDLHGGNHKATRMRVDHL